MKSNFTGFYSTPEDQLGDIWSAESTLFVFDTNCLLNLYRCEEHTRKDIINVMRKIGDRVWIPFQVGYEYQRNRRGVIEESINSLNKIKNALIDIYTQNILSSGGVKKHLYNNLNNELSDLQTQIKTPIDDYINNKIKQRIEEKMSISEHDFIRDDIDSIILDKVGGHPTQKEIEAIDEKGEDRYTKKIPPGFRDEAKKTVSIFSGIQLQDKFGDLYLWMQIIEKAKSDNIKNVIFVCDDNKQDWWFIHTGKTHGPLEPLKTEICKEANIENFRMINQLSFLNEAKNNLRNINISDSSLKEVEVLSTIPLVINESDDYYDTEKNQLDFEYTIWEDDLNHSDLTEAHKNNNMTHHHFNSNRYSPFRLHEIAYFTNSILKKSTEVTAKITDQLKELENLRAEIIKVLGTSIFNSLKNKLIYSLNTLDSQAKKTRAMSPATKWNTEKDLRNVEQASKVLLKAFYEAETNIQLVDDLLDKIKKEF